MVKEKSCKIHHYDKIPGKKLRTDFKDSLHAAEIEFKEEPMDENYSNILVGKLSKGRVVRLVKEMGNLKGKKVLDVGCEAGFVSLQFAKESAEVTSFDICEPALHNFRSKEGSSEIGIFLAAAQKMPIDDEVFDFVVCTEVLEHMPHREMGIKEMHRVMKKGGKLLLTFPNEKLRQPLYPLAKLFGVNTSVENEVTLFDYKFEDILKICEKHFKIEKKYSWPFFYPVTRFAVCKKVK